MLTVLVLNAYLAYLAARIWPSDKSRAVPFFPPVLTVENVFSRLNNVLFKKFAVTLVTHSHKTHALLNWHAGMYCTTKPSFHRYTINNYLTAAKEMWQ